nr:hypothetical protein [Tanacetum cinerariifolium]
MTHAQALMAIQTMADHSQNWHDGSSNKNIDSSSNSEGIIAIVRKLDSLGRDIKKLKENVYVIQVGCQLYGGPHLDIECPLNEETRNRQIKNGRGSSSLDITHEIKQVSKEEKQSVSYYVEPYDPSIPFPRRLEHHVEEALIYKTIESLKKIKINRPLLKEIRNTDNYTKHIKNLVANKPRTQEDEEIRMNPMCSALIQNQLPPKEEDLGSFILPRSIGRLNFNNTLADLGASINIMPLSMYKHLGTGKLKPINMMIEMADYTKCNPKGIIENLLVKINKFIFSVDFVIHDMVEDFRIPIILRRPFLAIARTKSERFKEEENDIKENMKDPEECEDDKSHVIMESIHDKLNDDWFKDTSKDEDDLEGIIDYLEPRSYDGFTDLDDEAYGSLSQEEEFEVTPTRIHV